MNIQNAFSTQRQNTTVSLIVLFLPGKITNSVNQGQWDQVKLECLLTEWIVVCDQPFDEVEKEEFVKLMTYAYHPAPSMKLSSWEGIGHHVMKMGEDTISSNCYVP